MRLLLIALLTGLIIHGCKPLTLKTDDNSTTVYRGTQPLVSYVHTETPAPEGQNPLYKRSGYIHPLYSPGGHLLTRIQPPDHYHHYGIWNPWTRTRFGEHQVDFWNLADGQGTVRFSEYLLRFEEKDTVGFRAGHEHIYFGKDGTEGLAMNEVWDVRVQGVKENVYVIDLFTTLTTPLEEGIILEAYRYGGGLGFRATEKWHTHNSTVLTSEGRTRNDADASSGRWVIVEGESSVPEGRSGILFLSHPSNRAHPEPMRVWPPDQNEGKENVFFEFCPIRHKEWILEKGKEYSLRYRMVVFDGTMDVRSAEKYWNLFSASY